jgi:hypothetical protein
MTCKYNYWSAGSELMSLAIRSKAITHMQDNASYEQAHIAYIELMYDHRIRGWHDKQ